MHHATAEAVTGNGESAHQRPDPADYAVVDSQVYRIATRVIRRFEDQPRDSFGKTSIEDLAVGIAAVGQKIPGEVRRLKPEEQSEGFLFELVDGERRLRACKIAGVPYFRAVIVEPKDAKDQWLKSVEANFGHENHTPIETAKIIWRLRGEEFRFTDQQIAAHLGKSLSFVRYYAPLIKLCGDAKALMDPDLPKDKRLGVDLARRLCNMAPSTQMHFVNKLKGGQETQKELIRQVKTVFGTPAEQGLAPTKLTFNKLAIFAEKSRMQAEAIAECSEEMLIDALKSAGGLQEQMAVFEHFEVLLEVATKLKERMEKLLQAEKV